MYGYSFKFYFWTPCGSKYGFVCLKFKRKTNNGELLGKHLDRRKKTQIACRLQDVFFFQLQGSCFYHLWRCGWVWNKKHLPLRLTRLGAKSVCGSAAEWGRAERGAASHPPDSLMDHHVDHHVHHHHHHHHHHQQQVIHQTLSWTIMWMGMVRRRKKDPSIYRLSTRAWKFQFDLKFSLYKVHCLHLREHFKNYLADFVR